MSEVEKFLAELPKDGEVFGDTKTEPSEEKQQQTEASAESPAETKPEQKEQPSQEGEHTPTEQNLPFHKHPRWKALQEERARDRELIENLQSQLNEVKEEKTEPEIPKWFSDVYGSDPSLWSQYSTMETQRRQEIKNEIYGELRESQNRQTEQATRWQNWVDSNIQSLRDDGAKFDENKLMDVVLKYRPIDEQGNIDIRKGYEIYSLMNQVPNTGNARREAAARATSSSKEPSVGTATPIDKLRRKSLADLAQEGL